PHRRPPRTFHRVTASLIHPQSNIDIHRSITPLQRSHQPDRHPPSRRNRNPPLRRVLLPSPPPLPKKCRKCLKCGAGALARECQQRPTVGHAPTLRNLSS